MKASEQLKNTRTVSFSKLYHREFKACTDPLKGCCRCARFAQCAVRPRLQRKHTSVHAHTCTHSPYMHAPTPTHETVFISVLAETARMCMCALCLRLCIHVTISVCLCAYQLGRKTLLASAPPPTPPHPPPKGTGIIKKGFSLPPSLIQTLLYF